MVLIFCSFCLFVFSFLFVFVCEMEFNNNNYSILIWIHTSHQPHCRIAQTQLWKIWTTQIILIGCIWLNITHIAYLMINISKIISTLHRVNGDWILPSQIFKHLVHNFHNFHKLPQYSFPDFASYTPLLEPPIEENPN